eukprot:6199954-Pleurochrysis_carterae.AAC.1
MKVRCCVEATFDVGPRHAPRASSERAYTLQTRAARAPSSTRSGAPANTSENCGSGAQRIFMLRKRLDLQGETSSARKERVHAQSSRESTAV